MPRVGIEPTRDTHTPLKRTRLPIPPPRQKGIIFKSNIMNRKLFHHYRINNWSGRKYRKTQGSNNKHRCKNNGNFF